MAEVTNTPWGERHAYVMPVTKALDAGSTSVLQERSSKQLHVSPLLSMDLRYDWRLTVPREHLTVHIEASSESTERSVFDATLSLRRLEIDAASLRRALVRYPLLTARIQARIYVHALQLRLRGAKWFAHPDRAAVA